MHNNLLHNIITLLIAFILSACSSSDSGRYKIANDKAPSSAPDITKVENAHPKYEAYSRGGNKKNYTVLGQSYQVMESGKGYHSSGTASWYGSKFHGHLTSNGETYDMYSMSAAHKTLPLPSFVKVTNQIIHILCLDSGYLRCAIRSSAKNIKQTFNIFCPHSIV